MLNTVECACSKITRRCNAPSFWRERETYLPASVTQTLNSCEPVSHARATNQIKETFATETCPFVKICFKRQRYPWMFQAARCIRRKLMNAQKTRSGVSFKRLPRFLFRHLVFKELVGTVHSIARRYNLCCKKRSDHSASFAYSAYFGVIRRDLSSTPATHGSSPVHDNKAQNVCQRRSTCAAHKQGWITCRHRRWL